MRISGDIRGRRGHKVCVSYYNRDDGEPGDTIHLMFLSSSKWWEGVCLTPAGARRLRDALDKALNGGSRRA